MPPPAVPPRAGTKEVLYLTYIIYVIFKLGYLRRV